MKIIVGFFSEGKTDNRFLISILEKTLTEVAFDDCTKLIDTEVYPISIDKTGLNFKEQVLAASKKGFDEAGIRFLCVHTDADDGSSANTYLHKITPATTLLMGQNSAEYCTQPIALVPVRETEAWMLADTALLKKQIGTNLTDAQLGIHGNPESKTDPKKVIEEAIRIGRASLPKKRKDELTIADLYAIIGQSLDLSLLRTLNSYEDFKKNVRKALKNIGC